MMQQQGGGLFGGQAPGGSAATAGRGLPELLGPAEVAEALGVSEADVMAIIATGELKAKKIGSSYRIKRAALDEYLAD